MDRTDPQHDTPTIRLTGTRQSEHDALAELFLGDAAFAPAPMAPRAEAARPTEPIRAQFEGTAVRQPRPQTPVQADDRPRPTVELVILGHLPVRASLWVRQYACLSARKRSETVALVRAAGGSVAVDVITGRQSAQIEPVDSIEDAVTIAIHAAPRVILRVDETVEPELLERAGVDEVTILTGADEAAVVASYRLIKTIVASLDDRLDPETSPALRVAVMGNPGAEIDAARQKIERACRAFLDRPIEILDASGRIDATGTASVCRVDAPEATAMVLNALLGPEAVPESMRPEPASVLRLADEPEDSDERLEPEPETPAVRLPEVVVRPIGRPGPAAAAPAPAAPPVRAEPVVSGFRREPLAALIEGLTPIESRCPGAAGVELACDDRGRVHAVSTDDAGAGEAVARLLAATAWARANLSLLIRAESCVAIPSADPSDDADPVMHLLARRPNSARAVLDTSVRVYALAAVDLGDEEIMVATPINAD